MCRDGRGKNKDGSRKRRLLCGSYMNNRNAVARVVLQERAGQTSPADALEKIAADPEELEAANNATPPMYIINPIAKLSAHEVSNLFSTHPATAERVRRFRQMGMGPISEPSPMREIPLQRLDD